MPRRISLADRLACLQEYGRDTPRAIVDNIGKVRPNKRKSGSIRYYIDLRPVCRIWGRPGEGEFEDERDAQRVLDAIQEQLRRRKTIEEAVTPYLQTKAKPVLVETRMKVWIDLKVGEADVLERSPTYTRKLKAYAKVDGAFSWWYGKSIHEITTTNVEDFSTWLRLKYKKANGDPLAKKSRHNILGAFHVFVGWLKRRSEIKTLPDFPVISLDENDPTIIEREDQFRILAQMDENAVGVFLAMCLLGIRPNEAQALRVCDYELRENPRTGVEEATIHVRKAIKGASLKSPVGAPKTKKTRSLPVPPMLKSWHAAQPVGLHPEQPLYRNPSPQARHPQRRWSYQSLTKRWDRAARKAGIKVSLYNGTKHSGATALYEETGDFRALQSLLGHADIRSTDKYTKVRNPSLRRIVDSALPEERQVGAKPSKKNPQ